MNENASNPTAGKAEIAEQVEVISLLRDMLHRLKNFWWVIILMTALGGALFYFRSSSTYTPRYMAEATVSVEIVNGGQYANQNTAEQMGTIFPYILTSGALSDVIATDLGTTGVPGTITVTSIRGTNLLTIDVTGREPEMTYAILQSVLKNYPEVAKYVVGQTNLTVIDDSGVPEDTGRNSVIRGSVKRGLLIGFALGVLMLLAYTMSTRTIRSESDLRSVLNVPCLGSLPFVRKKRRTKVINNELNMLYDRNCDEYMEAMRMIRTRLDRLTEGKKVLMVTSSIPGEGKSTVAANLAISIAQKGKKVILIDCDLRNPSQTSIFNLAGGYPGLGSVLRGESALEDSMVEIKVRGIPIGLTVIPGGDNQSRSVEILGGEAMSELLVQLRERADAIILDTPPSAMLMDAMILARHADGAVYVIMSDFAKRSYIYKGIEELNENAVPVLGCLLNGAAVYSGRYGYSKYGYGRYGYGYGYKSGYRYGSKYGAESEPEKSKSKSKSKSKTESRRKTRSDVGVNGESSVEAESESLSESELDDGNDIDSVIESLSSDTNP